MFDDITCNDTTIPTASGKIFAPLKPTADMICIGDIAHQLAQENRWGGAAARPYSVARHSVALSRLVPPNLAKAALLHDAAEAYVGDQIRPIKHLLGDYDAIEARIKAVIFETYDVDLAAAEDPSIKQADDFCCLMEGNFFFSGFSEWGSFWEERLRLFMSENQIPDHWFTSWLATAPTRYSRWEDDRDMFLLDWGVEELHRLHLV